MTMIPSAREIARMTPAERVDLAGWLRIERKDADTRRAEAQRAVDRLRAEMNEQENRARAATEHVRAIDLTLQLPDLQQPSPDAVGEELDPLPSPSPPRGRKD